MNVFKPDETMLHNYLQNKLSPQDEEQLELWLADHPEALEDLELDLLMKEGVNFVVNKAEKPIGNAEETSVWKKPLAWAASVSLMLLSAALTKTYLWTDASTDLNVMQPTIYEFAKTRSNGEEAITIQKSADSLLFVTVSTFDEGNYLVDILQSGELVYSVSDLEQQLAAVTLVIPKNSLDSGAYELSVTNMVSQYQEKYSFTVVD